MEHKLNLQVNTSKNQLKHNEMWKKKRTKE